MLKEQFSFDFEGKNEKSPATPELTQKYNFAEKDECSYCGQAFESPNSCQYCKSNPEKKAHLAKKK